MVLVVAAVVPVSQENIAVKADWSPLVHNIWQDLCGVEL